MSNELVSVIIPTYNSEKTILNCLKSIVNQTYKNIEIIIVDNFSTDKTIEIASQFKTRIIQIKSERARAKNIGLRVSRGKYVLFIDSDMELTPRVIEECVNLIKSNNDIAGIVIPERSLGKSFWVKVRDFERQLYAGTLIESPRFFVKSLALKVGGFDESVIFYEEATLPYKIEKLGYNVRARIRSIIIHHEENFSLKKWLMKKYYYGKTMKKYSSKYREYASFQTDPLYRIRILFSNKKFWKYPYLSIPLLLLKLLEYLFTLIGTIFK